MNAKRSTCRCEYNFTCRVCLDETVERNMADRNNNPPTALNSSVRNRQIFMDDIRRDIDSGFDMEPRR